MSPPTRPFRDLVGILFRFRSVDQPEELLQTGWRDDLEDPRRDIARVPERVPLAPRLEDEVGGAGFDLMTPVPLRTCP
jgi:hypothetical protein